MSSQDIKACATDITFQLNQYHGAAIHHLPAAKDGLQQLVEMTSEGEISARTFGQLRRENKSAYEWVVSDLYKCFQKGAFGI